MNTIRFDHPKKPLMVAHRGCSGLETENTAAAFLAAGNRSYFGIETDVRKTRDGAFLLHHDNTLNRLAEQDTTVEENDLATLRALSLIDKLSGEKCRGDLCLATLQEYIAICKRYEKIAVLELKNSFVEQDIYDICDVIAGMGYLEKTIFIAFNYDYLVYLRRKLPNQPAQFLIKEFEDDLIDRLKAQNLDLDIYHASLTAERVALCHQNGIKVNCWTVDDPERACELADMGVDFITSNILE